MGERVLEGREGRRAQSRGRDPRRAMANGIGMVILTVRVRNAVLKPLSRGAEVEISFCALLEIVRSLQKASALPSASPET